ncbi:MAG: N utilization substance protein A [Candidatus Paceibacteria bacterium]|jgi:N utilization substance protein A
MLDIKALNLALDQLEEERRVPKVKIIESLEQALAAAYRKDFGKKHQIIRSKIDLESGAMEFWQIKIVVDETTVRIPEEGEEEPEEERKPFHKRNEVVEDVPEGEEKLPLYNEEKHIFIDAAKLIRKDAKLEEELVFPLETEEEFGRVAAQTAKQVIMQGIREAERESVISEYGDKEGTVVSGTIQKIDRGNVIIDFGRATGMLPKKEQIPGEFYRQGARIKAYLYSVEEGTRGVNLWLSRTHPQFLLELFAIEAPEVAGEVVELKAIAREPGARSKVAVWSNDEGIDPIGSLVGQRGVRVTTVMNELGGEKIDIIEWSEDSAEFVAASLSPAKVIDIHINEETKEAVVEVAEDQLSLAIGKGGQNVRLAARLTGWKIDIKGIQSEGSKESEEEDGDKISEKDDKEYGSLEDLKEAVSDVVNDEEKEDKVDQAQDEETPAEGKDVAPEASEKEESEVAEETKSEDK